MARDTDWGNMTANLAHRLAGEEEGHRAEVRRLTTARAKADRGGDARARAGIDEQLAESRAALKQCAGRRAAAEAGYIRCTEEDARDPAYMREHRDLINRAVADGRVRYEDEL